MEKKRSNKKLFAIIGGSVLAFILTIALSVSITLAYFGDTSNATSTVKMSGNVMVGDVTRTDADILNALPGEYITFSGSYNVTSNGTSEDAYSPAFVRMKLTSTEVENFFVTNSGSTVTVDNTTAAITGAKWLTIGEYLYLVASGETKTDDSAKLFQVKTTGGSATVTFKFNAQVNPNLNNDWANESYTLTLNVTAIQGELPLNGAMTSDVKISEAISVFEQVETGNGQVAPTPVVPGE